MLQGKVNCDPCCPDCIPGAVHCKLYALLLSLASADEGGLSAGYHSQDVKIAFGASQSSVALQVVQALHSCFLYDTISFLDEARFHRLLPLLVQQLSLQLPPGVAARLQPQQADGNHEKADVYGDAVVAALVQMAVTAKSDILWKPLNHQVRDGCEICAL